MTTLTKQFIVVYNSDKEIVSKSNSNFETYVGDGMSATEFDSEDELNAFIEEKSLVETQSNQD